MAKIPTYISINETDNWGRLVNPREHVAAVGARMCDNRSRDFGIFGNRITAIGRQDVAERLQKWLFSKKTLKGIAKASHFVWGGDAFETDIKGLALGKKYTVDIHIRCCGEYCYIAAYADKVESDLNGTKQ